MQKQPWDPSVKALTAVPQTLAMMNDQLKWTQDLGDAFLAQQADVFDAVQRLRARADAAGNLKTTPQQKVVRTNRPAGSPASAPAQAYVDRAGEPERILRADLRSGRRLRRVAVCDLPAVLLVSARLRGHRRVRLCRRGRRAARRSGAV